MSNFNYGHGQDDLTAHQDNELSLRVFSEEFLYRGRHSKGFTNILEDLFIFTSEQLDVLKDDLETELRDVQEGE